MREAEFKAWLEAGGAETEGGRNTRVYAVRTIEQKLSDLGFDWPDLDAAWRDDRFVRLRNRLAAMREDAEQGGSDFRILMPKSERPTNRLVNWRNWLGQYGRFLDGSTNDNRDADRIRRFVLETYIEPAREDGRDTVDVHVRTVNDQLGLNQGWPNICQVLVGRKFLEMAEVPSPQRIGVEKSPATVFRFAVGGDESDLVVLARFDAACPGFAAKRKSWSNTETDLVLRLIRAVHDAGMDWYPVNITGAPARFGRKEPGGRDASAVGGYLPLSARVFQISARSRMGDPVDLPFDLNDRVPLDAAVIDAVERSMAEHLERWGIPRADRPGNWPDAYTPEEVDAEADGPDTYLVTALYGRSDGLLRFVERGEWTLLDDRGSAYNRMVGEMRPGDRLVMRDYVPQAKNLPFDGKGRQVPAFRIRAIGTVTGQRDDGIGVDVAWSVLPDPRMWYFYTNPGTIWRIRRDKETARRLLAFLDGGEQDIAWFLAHPFWADRFGDGVQVDAAMLKQLHAAFLAAYPDFRTFEQPGRFAAEENDYKRALAARAAELLADPALADDASLGAVLLDLVAGKGGLPSNLLDWRTAKLIDAVRANHPGIAEQATGQMARGEDSVAAVAEWADTLWPLMTPLSETQPFAESRTVPTMVRALVDPTGMLGIRSTPTENAARMLIGRWAFKSQPLSVEDVEGALALADAIFAVMRDTWGWMPRDYWDVQGFLWVTCQKRLLPDETFAVGNAAASDSGPCWFVGVAFGGDDDQLDRFLTEGIWEIDNPSDKHREQVLRMAPGERIAAKATYVRKNDLPFENHGRPVSCMAIKATGTITANTGNGSCVSVAWDPVDEPRVWYHYTYQPTIWEVYPNKETARRLIRFAFHGEAQDIEWFMANLSNWKDLAPPADDVARDPVQRDPVNLILYGPPGTGKTYATMGAAVRLCMGLSMDDPLLSDPDRREDLRETYDGLRARGQIGFVTFHQNFSYEDFVEGMRPTALTGGGFTLEPTPGIFRLIAEAARKSAEEHVLVIDEINRANVSRVFGELITLIETDKRQGMKERLTLSLPYSRESFGVPANLHIIGTMNTADRSIAQLDTALRRRFRFEEIAPQPGLLGENVDGVPLRAVLAAINDRIEYLVDRDHRIGHAFFMGCDSRAAIDAAMRDKVIPLLQEYFFEDWSRIAAVVGKGFIEERKLAPPPGLDFAETRSSWAVRAVFADDAYGILLGKARQAEPPLSEDGTVIPEGQ
ncbi:AAA family ATPase [Novosphingobium sp. KCTC 2891]|uniref:McrB family protein n=1 Tax=Novosphingobium sp. KCTC 2891 TaxID=2989730 RepID=UPI002223750C|nr:AAA family ATPase [Novosphingobium sp. KCTC 2891]MCW1385077.1 AAA family ATPase [Novosphingobium sp. KCTC 2891]